MPSDNGLNYTTVGTPIGEILIAGTDSAIRYLSFQDTTKYRIEPADDWQKGGDVVLEARRQLLEYFDRKRQTFDVPLDPQGTPFQRQVWDALVAIPYGETRSYGQQAESIGRAGAQRAVGAANGRNPIAIIIPCHRVIGSTGKLTGFGGGLPTKEFLLDLERGQLNFETRAAS